ncbi:uncharacterized protein A4U43_C10F7970 [Asparagus officinalis]|uniref:Uncharacterized protein n=1 Tax=Asparagus officinalis TaxID=4686 RepID=A0A5P1E1T6_ASPOF|nr:uncharacterized protein A4U43_C10F7970 [Asparagus officinalis]
MYEGLGVFSQTNMIPPSQGSVEIRGALSSPWLHAIEQVNLLIVVVMPTGAKEEAPAREKAPTQIGGACSTRGAYSRREGTNSRRCVESRGEGLDHRGGTS